MRPNDSLRRAVVETMRAGMTLEDASRFYGLKKETLLRWASDAPSPEPDELDQRILNLEAEVNDLRLRLAEMEQR